MECLEDGQVKDAEVGQHSVLILSRGQCHRVRNDGRKAASVIVKNNLSYNDTCEYFPQPKDYALYQRWETEKKA
jgi:dTDP-4-dehydrorhamnose 3,5-epimerase-like enzyme